MKQPTPEEFTAAVRANLERGEKIEFAIGCGCVAVVLVGLAAFSMPCAYLFGVAFGWGFK